MLQLIKSRRPEASPSLSPAAHANATLITDRSRPTHIKCRGESVGSGSLVRLLLAFNY